MAHPAKNLPLSFKVVQMYILKIIDIYIHYVNVTDVLVSILSCTSATKNSKDYC